MTSKKLRVAIVHDWLVTYGGAERVLVEMLKTFPDADLFSLVDFFTDADRQKIMGKRATTSFVQKLPLARKKYRQYLPLMPFAVEQFDLSGYDVVLSSSFALAKGVITGPDQLHVCMCYSPMRYVWDLTHQYLRQTNLDHGLKGWITKYMLHRLRIWDYRTGAGVDRFIAISDYVSRRIKKVYGRDSTIIFPPVDVGEQESSVEREQFYLTASRMVPYKRIDLIVKAFSQSPERKLVVIGAGPEFSKISRLAGPNVSLLGFQSDEVLRDHMKRAKAFIFAAEEDFGIIPIEAQSHGTPVIAFGKGGALETIIEGETGIFFGEQTVETLLKAVELFEEKSDHFDPRRLREHAETFGTKRFHLQFDSFMNDAISDFFKKRLENKPIGNPISREPGIHNQA